MMNLDPRTIYLTGAAFVAIGAIHLLVLAQRLPVEHRRSARSWAFGCFAASASWAIFALEQFLPDLATVLFGNLAYLVAVFHLFRSVRLFDGLLPGWHLYYLLVLPVITLNLVLRYVVDLFPARVALMSLAVALPLGLAAHQLLRGPSGAARNTGRQLTAAWLLASCVILVVRAAAALLGVNVESAEGSPAQGLVLVASLLSVTALVFSYYLLYFDRSTTELRFQAERDPLTGLLNRRAFHSRAAREIRDARERRKQLSLLLIDANHFKLINDEQGHDAGDETLRHIAATLQRNLRLEDVSARLGGDEFVVLLPGLDEFQARTLATRVAERVADASSSNYVTSVSIGVAQLRSGSDIDLLLKEADLELYREKRKRDGLLTGVQGPISTGPLELRRGQR
ncbi:MAG TPA: GGDEF domain-containing protein [Trueperaceae bacterium]